MVSVTLCPRRICLLGQFSDSGVDGVSTCSVLFSVERLSLSHFLRVDGICHGQRDKISDVR